ncbi:MAG TPA: ORF6N domain-containing protein [Chitinophagaceae bacterium]|nr:ORF6N domain-containing protein [Chitinophagaceae bacterium]
MAKAKRNIIKLVPEERIFNKIHIIRDQKVMLDFDLANLYEVETKALNQAVKRNAERFPKDFMFRLTTKEWIIMRSQFVTSSAQATDSQLLKAMRSQIAISSQSKRKDTYTPYAFTEHGVTMLASVLKSERAVKMSIAVVRAFIELKKNALQYNEIVEQIENLKSHLGEHDVQLNKIYEAIENLLDDKADKELKEATWKKRKRIGFRSDE